MSCRDHRIRQERRQSVAAELDDEDEAVLVALWAAAGVAIGNVAAA